MAFNMQWGKDAIEASRELAPYLEGSFLAFQGPSPTAWGTPVAPTSEPPVAGSA